MSQTTLHESIRCIESLAYQARQNIKAEKYKEAFNLLEQAMHTCTDVINMNGSQQFVPAVLGAIDEMQSMVQEITPHLGN